MVEAIVKTPASPRNDAWLCMSIRFTAFTEAGFANDGERLYDEFYGFAPNDITQKKAEFLTEYSTTAAMVTFSSVLAGPKLDFVKTNTFLVDDPTGKSPLIHESVDFVPEFIKSAIRIVKLCPEINRIAVGAQYIHPTEGREQGYEILAELLPSVKIDVAGSQELFYRINRPRRIPVGDGEIAINRLCHWSCLTVAAEITRGDASKSSWSQVAVHVIPDISTAPETNFTQFDFNSQKNLIILLFEYAKELAIKGDIP